MLMGRLCLGLDLWVEKGTRGKIRGEGGLVVLKKVLERVSSGCKQAVVACAPVTCSQWSTSSSFEAPAPPTNQGNSANPISGSMEPRELFFQFVPWENWSSANVSRAHAASLSAKRQPSARSCWETCWENATRVFPEMLY